MIRRTPRPAFSVFAFIGTSLLVRSDWSDRALSGESHPGLAALTLDDALDALAMTGGMISDATGHPCDRRAA